MTPSAAPEFARLRELLAKATKAPWKWAGTRTPERCFDGSRLEGEAFEIEFLGGREGGKMVVDGHLIAESRNALPALLDRLDALAAENAKLRAALKPFAEHSFADDVGDETCSIFGVDWSGADEPEPPTVGDFRRASAALAGGAS